MFESGVKGFIEYIEDFVLMQHYPAKKYSKVPAVVKIEFTEEDWEHLKETGDWQSLRKRDEAYLKEAQEDEARNN